jgi:hypothetical protein
VNHSPGRSDPKGHAEGVGHEGADDGNVPVTRRQSVECQKAESKCLHPRRRLENARDTRNDGEVLHSNTCGEAGLSVQDGLDYRKVVESTLQLVPGQVV